jgi:hypothetical protein
MSIPFTCPHCGKSVVVEDHFAGQVGPCAGCGRPITIPMPVGAPGTAVGAGAVGVLGIILGIGVACLMLCVGVGGVMYALLIPAVDRARQVAARTESTNNLKQIMLALQNYELQYGSYPPAYVTDAEGKPLYSWRVLILPYLEERELYDQFDLTKAWDDPANKAVSDSLVKVFHSPLDDEMEENGTSYIGFVGRNTMFPTGSGRKSSEVPDGAYSTITVIEVKGWSGSWAAPIDPTLSQFSGVAIVGEDAGQLHPAQANGAVLVGYADGMVRQLNASAAARVVQPVAVTVNDGQPNAVE